MRITDKFRNKKIRTRKKISILCWYNGKTAAGLRMLFNAPIAPPIDISTIDLLKELIELRERMKALTGCMSPDGPFITVSIE